MMILLKTRKRRKTNIEQWHINDVTTDGRSTYQYIYTWSWSGGLRAKIRLKGTKRKLSVGIPGIRTLRVSKTNARIRCLRMGNFKKKIQFPGRTSRKIIHGRTTRPTETIDSFVQYAIVRRHKAKKKKIEPKRIDIPINYLFQCSITEVYGHFQKKTYYFFPISNKTMFWELPTIFFCSR